MKTIGPNALEAMLEAMGLKLVKTRNLPINAGRSAELVACTMLSITERATPARWRELPRNVEMSAAPMPETEMIGPD